MAVKRRRRGRRRRRGGWFSRLSAGNKIAVCLAGVFLALATTGVVYAAAKLSQLNTNEIPQGDIVINDGVEQLEDLGEGYLNVALFGVDSREGDLEKNTRTDTIIVASLNKKTKEIRMASVYRDTLLDLSEGTLQKCNAAYSFGGPTQAINMLNMNLDLDIQKYITVDFGVVTDVIDLLGGLDIEITKEEEKYLNEFVYETGVVAGKEPHFIGGSGLQHMDGVQATTYARIRSTAGGDFTRTERQRLVIEKMVEKLMKSDLRTINKIIDEVFPTVSTNFSITEILNYAKYFTQYKLGENTGFPMDKATDTVSGLGSIVIPVTLEDNVRQLHEFLFGTTDYSPSSEVQDISDKIVSRIGRRKAEDDSVLNEKTYEADPQEAPDYKSSKKNSGSGSSDRENGSGGGGSYDSGNGSGGDYDSGGDSSGDVSGGGFDSGSDSDGGSSADGSEGGNDSDSDGESNE